MKGILVIFSIISLAISFAQPNVTDAKGRKQGEWGKAYPKSNVYIYRGQFKDDKPVGTFTYFYPSRKVKAVVKHDPTGNRSVGNFYHENGQIMSIGIYRNEKKDSVWMNFGPSGRLSNTETYLNDSLHGKKTVYYIPPDLADKRQIVASVYNFENGQVEGSFTEYFDNGQVKKTGQYLNHRRHGEWITYELGGQRMMLERFKNGQKHGWFIGYENGKEANRMYFHFGNEVKGDALKDLMQQMKAKGINPNE